MVGKIELAHGFPNTNCWQDGLIHLGGFLHVFPRFKSTILFRVPLIELVRRGKEGRSMIEAE